MLIYWLEICDFHLFFFYSHLSLKMFVCFNVWISFAFDFKVWIDIVLNFSLQFNKT